MPDTSTIPTETPLSAYRELLKTGDLKPDPAQALAVEKLQSLQHALKNYEPSGGLSGWKARFGLTRRREDPPQGVYFYGGVGRGKSMLMDLFYRCSPVERKRRVHFHAFMQDVHARFKELRVDKKHGDDPIPPLAAQMAEESWLICFDEFQVTDIADAMILGRLFERLFEAGVVVVATSNRPPRDLYKGGLQREKFLTFVDLIEGKLDILAIDGVTDYRLDRLTSMDVFLHPHNQEADRALHEVFERLTHGRAVSADQLTVHKRRVVVPYAAEGVALAEFADLCEKPLGPADYLEIARRYHTLVMPGIPRMGPSNRNEAKRFVTLIDALYEHKVNLICSAETSARELYMEGDGSFEFERTVSRLLEMQSDDYMASPHNRVWVD